MIFHDMYQLIKNEPVFEIISFTTEILEEYQLEHLSTLLQHAYENVPYYRKKFEGDGKAILWQKS
ncbi:MAG: hypothetical protein KAT65_14845 [Methanophagales archaeon]|nr:hypothetical protein [Methanophagales archaeon]